MSPSMLSIILAFMLDVNSFLAFSSELAICTKKWCDLCAIRGKAKKIAKKKGIAFTHISTELGKSRGYLSEMLANGRDLPDHMLADVASLLGVTVDDLRGDTENEKKPTAQSDGLISSLPQDVQEIISLCQKNPRLASALLNLAHQLQNRSSDPA